MSTPFRRWTALLVVVLSTGVVACSSNAPSATSRGSDAGATAAPPDSETFDAAPDTSPDATTPSADVSVLTAAGMSIVEHEDQPVEADVTDAGHTMITMVQARRMVADVSIDSGILGSDIDAMAVLPADVPSLSYLVAGWVTQGTSPSAVVAHQWMGDQDWTHAPTVRFPMAVLAMFVTEMAVGTAAEVPQLADPLPTPNIAEVLSAAPSGGFRSSIEAPMALAGGACTAVTQFISQSITGIFNALRIAPPSGDGILVSIGQVLAGVFNFGVSLAQGIVQGLVSVLTAPVLNLIAIAVGALGVVTVIASFFKDNTLTLHLAPPPPAPTGYRFAIDQEPEITGDFVATAKELTGDWPPLLKDCAEAAGVSLPELLPAGAATIWEVTANGLISTGSPNGVVEADHTARLKFTTGRESQEAVDHGVALSNAATATVRIPRKEVDAILDFARSKVNDAQASILAKVPAAVRGAAAQALSSVVDPTLNRIQSEVSMSATGVFTLSGTTSVFVLHHGAPDTTTSSSEPETVPPDSSDEGDFCTQYAALLDFARNNQPGDVVVWATEIVNRLQTMRPVAPAELLGDVDIELRVYTAVAASADVTVLIQTTEPLPEASARIGAFCGLSG